MILRRVEIESFRRYRAPMQLTFDPRFTVVSGLNEAGKTTFFLALQYAFFRRSGANAADIEALRPWGTSGVRPRVLVEFEYDGRELRLEKLFGKDGRSRLDERGLDGAWQVWKEEGADDYIASIFGASRPGKDSSKPFGRSIRASRISCSLRKDKSPSPRATGTIRPPAHARMASLIGEAGQTGDEARIARQIATLCNAHWTPSGKRKKTTQSEVLAARLVDLRKQLDEQKVELGDLERHARELSDLEQQRNTLAVEYEAARAEAAASRPRFLNAVQLKGELDVAARDLASASEAYEETTQRYRSVQECDTAIGAARLREDELRGALERCRRSLDEARASEEATRGVVAAAFSVDPEIEALKRDLEVRRRVDELAQQETRLDVLAAEFAAADRKVSAIKPVSPARSPSHGRTSISFTLLAANGKRLPRASLRRPRTSSLSPPRTWR